MMDMCERAMLDITVNPLLVVLLKPAAVRTLVSSWAPIEHLGARIYDSKFERWAGEMRSFTHASQVWCHVIHTSYGSAGGQRRGRPTVAKHGVQVDAYSCSRDCQ